MVKYQSVYKVPDESLNLRWPDKIDEIQQVDTDYDLEFQLLLVYYEEKNPHQ
jgi:hypothetical protein